MSKDNAKADSKKKEINGFMEMLGMAELKALSNVSLERPLTEVEFARMMQLKKELLE